MPSGKRGRGAAGYEKREDVIIERDQLRERVQQLEQQLKHVVTAADHQSAVEQLAQQTTANEQLQTTNQELEQLNKNLTERAEIAERETQQAQQAAQEAESLRAALENDLAVANHQLEQAREGLQTSGTLLKEAQQQAERLPGFEVELAAASRRIEQLINMHPVEFNLQLLADNTAVVFPKQSAHLRRLARWTGQLIDEDGPVNDYRFKVGDPVLAAETRTWACQPRPDSDRRVMLVLTQFQSTTSLGFTIENVNGKQHERLVLEGLLELLTMLASKLTDLDFLEMIEDLAEEAMGKEGFSISALIKRFVAFGDEEGETGTED